MALWKRLRLELRLKSLLEFARARGRGQDKPGGRVNKRSGVGVITHIGQ